MSMIGPRNDSPGGGSDNQEGSNRDGGDGSNGDKGGDDPASRDGREGLGGRGEGGDGSRKMADGTNLHDNRPAGDEGSESREGSLLASPNAMPNYTLHDVEKVLKAELKASNAEKQAAFEAWAAKMSGRAIAESQHG
jgi:hypothetical protein